MPKMSKKVHVYLSVKHKTMNTKASIWFNQHSVYIIKLPLVTMKKNKFYDIKNTIDIGKMLISVIILTLVMMSYKTEKLQNLRVIQCDSFSV